MKTCADCYGYGVDKVTLCSLHAAAEEMAHALRWLLDYAVNEHGDHPEACGCGFCNAIAAARALQAFPDRRDPL